MGMKPMAEILKADPRNALYDSPTTGKPMSINDRYSQIAAITISSSAPPDVKSYFGTLQDLCVYAWYAYEFYGLVVFLSFTLIEMALRLRLSLGPGDKRALDPLLREAFKRNLINEKSFTHIKRIRQTSAQELKQWRRFEKLKKSNIPKRNYLMVLQKSLPKLRNAHAHPTGQAIYLPHEGIFSLRFAAEFINQLYP
jgi:hypothetical protein